MKIKGTNLEVNNIGDFEKIKSNIAAKDLGLALTMVSKNLYSNPIGSFVRELTSNAVDANVDANVNEAVLIHLYKEGSSYYIEFKDNGTGMSPEVFRNVYMSWFNSDKRDTNTKIGGWGLGSKSPLSYQDSFEVITRHDGTEYHYILVNEGAEPDASLIVTNPTESGNGTTIRVEVNEVDIDKVQQEIIKQLAYFRRVYVKNDLRYYDNNFKLYESDLYILRNTKQPFGVDMHICLGQVAYPINWNVLGIERIKMPVGIKFEIGELDVTLSREEINYTEEIKALVLSRIEEVKDALLLKYSEQLQIENFGKYISILKDKSKPDFKIEDVTISMTDFTVTPKFTELPDIKFVKKYIDNIFTNYTIDEIRSGRDNRYSHFDVTDYVMKRWTGLESYIVTDRLNTYDSLRVGTGVALIKKRKLNRKDLLKFALALDLVTNKKGIDDRGFVPEYKPGYIRTIFTVTKYIDNYMTKAFTHYNGIATPEWIENYKREQQELYEERKQVITHYSLWNTRDQKNWGELIDKYKVIFYISKKASNKDKVAYMGLYDELPAYFKNNSVFLIINPSVIDKIKRKRKFVAIERIFKIKEFSSTLYRIKLSRRVAREITPAYSLFYYSKYYMSLYSNLSKTYYLNYSREEYALPYKKGDYSYTENINVDFVEHFEEQFNALKPTKNRTHLPYEDNFNILNEVKEKLDVLNYVQFGCPHNYLVKIIGRLGVLRLNAKYYKSNPNN